MTDLRKAAEMALDSILDIPMDRRSFAQMEAVTALRQALAEPANSPTDFLEPVAWIGKGACQQLQKGAPVTTTLTSHKAFLDDVPLYTAPPKAAKWVWLTDEEIITHFQTNVDTGSLLSFADGVRYAEAKLRDKNAGNFY